MSGIFGVFLVLQLLLPSGEAYGETICSNNRGRNMYQCVSDDDVSNLLVPYRPQQQTSRVLSIKGNFISMQISPKCTHFDDVTVSSPRLAEYPEALRSFTGLEFIKVIDSGLTAIDFAVFPISLIDLDLSGNRIRRLRNVHRLALLENLSVLAMPRNKLKSFPLGSLPSSMTHLMLRGNGARWNQAEVEVLNRQLFFVKHFRVLNLKGNHLRCNCSSFRSHQLRKFDPKISPKCDYVRCFMCHWLKRDRLDISFKSNDQIELGGGTLYVPAIEHCFNNTE